MSVKKSSPQENSESIDFVQVDEVKTVVSGSIAYNVPDVGMIEEDAALSNIERNGKFDDQCMHRVSVNGKVIKVTDCTSKKVIMASKDYDFKFVKMIDENLNLKAMTVANLPVKIQNDKIVIVDQKTNNGVSNLTLEDKSSK